jgi:hypothetical protein
MTVSADQLRELMALGLDGEKLLAVVTIMSRGLSRDTTDDRRAKDRARQQARRDKLRVLRDAAKANDVAASSADASRDTVTPHCDLISLSSSSLASSEVKKARGTASVVEGRKRGTRMAEDWQPRNEDREFVRSLGLDDVAVRDEYVDYWIAVPGVRGTKLNWFSTYRNRARELALRGKGPLLNGKPNGQPPNAILAALDRTRSELRARGLVRREGPPDARLLPQRGGQRPNNLWEFSRGNAGPIFPGGGREGDSSIAGPANPNGLDADIEGTEGGMRTRGRPSQEHKGFGEISSPSNRLRKDS